MAIFSLNQLQTLIEQPQGRCVSLFFPTVKAGAETRQNPIRFSNMMSLAVEKLEAAGMRRPDAERILEPAFNLDKTEFWQYQGNGLAIFVAENFFRYYRLPLELEELAVVGDRFHVKPLLPLLMHDGRFYILALSQNQVRLFQATRDRVLEVNLNHLEEVPQSLADALKYEDPEREVQYHSSGGAGPSFTQGHPIFHGQGVGTTDNKNEIKRFFDQLDRGLLQFLDNERVPLVLAGVDYLLPIYRAANTHPYLVLEDCPLGNPEILKPEEIHQQAWTVVKPHFQQEQKDAARAYAELSANAPQQVSDNLEEVVKAARYKRIDTLFVERDRHFWGQFQAEENAVIQHDSQQEGDEDLLDLAAVDTLLNSGLVYVVPGEAIPADAPVAAAFRY